MAENCTTDAECAAQDTCGRYKCEMSTGECYLPAGSDPCVPTGRFAHQVAPRRRGFDGGLWFNFSEEPSNDLWFNASSIEEDGTKEVEKRSNGIDKYENEFERSDTKPLLGGTEPTNPEPASLSRTSSRERTDRGRKITIRGDLNNIEGFLSQAQAQGKLEGMSASQVKGTLTAAAMKITGGGTDPGAGKFWKCKSSCSAWGGSGTCLFGGCFNVLNCCPPDKFEITWDF